MGSHPTPLADIVRVHHAPGAYTSKLISLVSLPPGALLAPMSDATPTTTRAYTSVQTSASTDIELNSDLVYANHSCAPSVIFDVEAMEVRAGEGGLKEGQEVTFFYPSTEWDMRQPFECGCGEKGCLGTVRGARFLDGAVLGRWWVNGHVRSLVEGRGERGEEIMN